MRMINPVHPGGRFAKWCRQPGASHSSRRRSHELYERRCCIPIIHL